MKFLTSSRFVLSFLAMASTTGVFFMWEIGLFKKWIPSLTRPAVTKWEIVFIVLLILLLSMNTGLLMWQKKYGSCPIGTKRMTGIAGMLGIVALVCPVCLALPFALVGVSVILATVSPYMPLLKIISIFLLSTSTLLLWPKKVQKTVLQTEL